MSRTSASSLERRVADAAGEALTRQKYVTAVDVCLGLRWVHIRATTPC